jgi:hypothetical protein
LGGSSGFLVAKEFVALLLVPDAAMLFVLVLLVPAAVLFVLVLLLLVPAAKLFVAGSRVVTLWMGTVNTLVR